MKILSLTLKGFRRLDLIGVDNLHYTPESPYQLILGVSGTGKSSILNELSPLPCDSNDLREGGCKIIEIEHRDIKYVLSYYLHKKLDCSFVRDGKELNEGNTIKIQRDLILEHFNYDNKIHDILIGHTLLTTMSTAERREWFTKMSNADMTYAIALYNKLRGAERDIRGAIKLNNQRLANEQVKLPSPEDVERAKSQSHTLKQELNHLLPFTQQGLVDYSKQIMDIGRQIMDLTSTITDTKFVLQVEGLSDDNLLQTHLEQLKQQKVQLENEFHRSSKELHELHDVYDKNQKLAEKPLHVIDEQIEQIQQQLRQNNQQATQYAYIELQDNYHYAFNTLPKVHAELKEIILAMRPNPVLENGERQWSKQSQDTLTQQVRETQQQLIQEKNRLSFLEREYTNLQNIHAVTCPNCSASFKPGVDCDKLTKLDNERTALNERIGILENQYNQLSGKLSEFNEWMTPRVRYTSFFSQYTELTQLNELLVKHDNFRDNPIGLLPIIDEYYRALKCKDDYYHLIRQLNTLEEERIRRVAAEGSDMEYVITRMKSLEEYIHDTKHQLDTLHQQLQQFNQVIHDRQLLASYREKLKDYLATRETYIVNQIQYENNAKLLSIIQDKQLQLATSERFVSGLTQTETVIEQLEKANQQYQQDQKALQILTTLLSPQDGLIAESLIGFINQFLEEMSNVLDQIWTYKLCPYLELDEEGIDLDYRFKVDIEGLERPVGDVARLSTGQKEVVDFVFKLLLMQHLDMRDYPVFMDEIGGRFDALHRDRLYRYVKLLVESNQIQQVFIISHIASSHDVLTQADKCILDTDATMVDKTVNRVFKLS